MIDAAAAAVQAVSAGSPAAAGLVFAAGALTSIGPCVAPRYVAVAALAQSAARPGLTLAAYVAGLIGAFTALGFAAGSLGMLWSMSGALYGVLAVSLVVSGGVMLVRAAPPAAHAVCGNAALEPHDGRSRSLGAVVLLGAAGAFVVSPCCTPVLAAAGATSAALGKPLVGALLLACFAAGHALPLIVAGSASAAVSRLAGSRFAQASAIVGAVLTIALGAYYGIIA